MALPYHRTCAARVRLLVEGPADGRGAISTSFGLGNDRSRELEHRWAHCKVDPQSLKPVAPRLCGEPGSLTWIAGRGRSSRTVDIRLRVGTVLASCCRPMRWTLRI